MKHQFKTNIMCGSCVSKVTPHLNAQPRITHWEVDTQNRDKVLTVETDDLTENEIQQLVNNAGYKAEKMN